MHNILEDPGSLNRGIKETPISFTMRTMSTKEEIDTLLSPFSFFLISTLSSFFPLFLSNICLFVEREREKGKGVKSRTTKTWPIS